MTQSDVAQNNIQKLTIISRPNVIFEQRVQPNGVADWNSI